ncbi:uncharacterized protein LOC131688137 [Topomyia yanbarensis]|uniref:uncharacterized protein LOC131688137 n=1 Tax=Topomyia yanbarensis TaxID=2498891 RepID=UPI00273B2708|nr:uncharacterized protein LOC131688137 [Topomyia yanbarensis]
MSDPGMDAASKPKGTSGAVVVTSTPTSVHLSDTEHKTKPSVNSCTLCNKPDDDHMVQCDTCDVWNHFSCAGVSENVEECSWICLKCATVKAKKGTKSRRKNTSKQKLTKTSRKTTVRATTAKTAKKVTSKAERKSNVGGADAKGENVPVVETISKDLEKPTKSRTLSRADSVTSAASRKSIKARLDVELRKIKAEEMLMQEEMRLMREFSKKKFDVLKKMADFDSSDESAGDHQHEKSNKNKVQDWLKHSTKKEVETDGTSDRETSESDSDSDCDTEVSSCLQANDADGEEVQSDEEEYGISARSVSKRRQALCSNKRLSKSEVAARQVVPRELPKFNGNPEEWPMFLSTYEDTTAMCGYTAAENMIRLRNCLKGDAFNAVRSFLMRPETVGKAISALKLRFGRPETIIEYLKEKIIAISPIKSDAMEKLVDYALEVQNLCAIIQTCGGKEHMCDTTLLRELVKKLPSQIKLDWARYKRTKTKVTLSTFSRWIYTLAEDVNVVFEPQCRSSRTQESREIRKERYVNTLAEVPTEDGRDMNQSIHSTQSSQPGTEGNKPCPACRGDCKYLGKCKRFLELSYEARWATVRGFNFCRKCLRQHRGGCNSGECGKNGCTFKHHILLHKDLLETSASTSVSNQNEERNVNTHQSSTGPGSFRYLPVTLFGNGVQMKCHAFLDDGSELTLIDQQLAEDLKLSGKAHPLCLKWTAGTHRYESGSHSVNVEISGQEGKRTLLQDVRTVEELQLPFQSLDMTQLTEKHGYLRGVPVESYSNVRPRILIGLKHANIMLVRKSREGRMGEPIAVKTNLGWTVYGGWTSKNCINISHTYHVCSCNQQSVIHLNQMVKDYFSLENSVVIPTQFERLSKEDKLAMSLLESRTHFNGERYVTGLLWRSDKVRLPDNKTNAIRRWRCLEKRLEKDKELSKILDEKIKDYQSKNYVRKLSTEELSRKYERVWYLPIFPVYNPNKPGKIRIVWDAAASVYGTSLNSTLLTGPDQLASLVGILYQFREHRIGLCADICEMFHQVGIIAEDQQCQRFLWRDSEEHGEPSTYVMQVMTFGASCSPATAQFVKNKNADRFEGEYPEAVTVIKEGHYVDDMVVSVETEQEAVALAESVHFIHKQGGFEIRNWVSNSPLVLARMHEQQSREKDLNICAELSNQKILGMWWDTQDDVFKYKISWARFESALLDGSRCPTKREILRTLMTIYDPLGLIDHFLILLKILLQEVWRANVEWDVAIPTNLYERWRDWLRLLPELEKLRIPRCYRQFTKATEADAIQLHIFVDASESSMAAVVFLRFANNDQIECSLVAAKTRVAPLKYTSIPRLELQAAVLGCRLAANVTRSLKMKISKRTFWTDSRNVLCWLRADHKRYSAFVGSRVSEILESTDIVEWRWVPTRYNVADDGTRWREHPDLSSESRWFKGSAFLRQAEVEWPILPQKSLITDEEMRPSVLLHFLAPEAVIDVNRFSNWRRLLAVTAYVFRFCANVQRHRKRDLFCSGPLSRDELRRAEEYHFRQAQRDVYQDEIAVLETKDAVKRISKASSLYKLSPFIDDSGVMRMRGRTGVCAYLHNDAKNPVILPPKHMITSLILVHYHEMYLHLFFA